jgi:hypothetical protein
MQGDPGSARWNRLEEVNLKVAARRLGDHRRGAGVEVLRRKKVDTGGDANPRSEGRI